MRALFARLSSHRCLWAVAIALGELAGPDSVRAEQEGQTDVLVLYSTRRDAEIVTVVDRELPRILEQYLGQPLDHYSEYIDQARFPDPAYRTAFRDFLQLKYKWHRFDVVIAVQDVAVEFLANHRNELFPGTPLVFLANSPVRLRPQNSTGIIAELSLGGTLGLATALQPAVRHAFVVSGATARDKAYEAVARVQLQPFESMMTVTYLSGLPAKDLEARLATLPANSIVYFLLVYRDGEGENFHPLEYLNRVTAIANAPVYCWVDSAMGHGIVGGKLRDQRAVTAAVGNLVVRVLRGERADDIPVSSADLSVNQVDWRQLRRWGISEARVPPGTLIKFREPSAWDRYRIYILSAGAMILVQTALITGLLVQRTRRRRAEAQVRGLGSRLLDAQETERSRIARELHDDIGQQLALLTLDLELLADAPAQRGPLATEALQRANDIATSVHDLSHRLHPAKLRLLGLASALQALQREVIQSDVSVTVTYDNFPSTLPPDLTLCLFRIVQEAVQNGIKYSKAKGIAVHLARSMRGLTLSIVDDGIGFDVKAAWGKGLGLVSMRERLDAVGGTLEIRSETGVGTQLKVWVPLPVIEDSSSVAAI
jgi:signal transduction histidine kinase